MKIKQLKLYLNQLYHSIVLWLYKHTIKIQEMTQLKKNECQKLWAADTLKLASDWNTTEGTMLSSPMLYYIIKPLNQERK